MLRGVLITSSIPPYRVEVYESLADAFPGEMIILCCTSLERNRQWGSQLGSFQAKTLAGLRIPYGSEGTLYVNPQIVQELLRYKPDVMCIAGFSPTMLLASIYGRLMGVPYVVQSDSWSDGDFRRGSAVHSAIRRFVVQNAAAGVSVGPKGLRWLESFGMAKHNLFLSPLVPGWDPPETVPGFDERAFDLLWCGTLNARKGIDIFVAVAERLKEERSAVSVRIVGYGPEQEWCLDRMRKAGISFTFDGYLGDQSIQEAFSSARLFLFPTRLDPWGLVANEAASCGTPVILSPHAGAADDFIRDGKEGRIIPLDVDAWARAANELLDSPTAWEAMSTNAILRAKSATREQAALGLRDAMVYALGERAPSAV